MTDKPKRKRKRVSDSEPASLAPKFDDDIVPDYDIVEGIPDTAENIARTMWGKTQKSDGGYEYKDEALRRMRD